MEVQELYTVTETPSPDYRTMHLTIKEVYLIRRLRQLQNEKRNAMLIIELYPRLQWRCTSAVEG